MRVRKMRNGIAVKFSDWKGGPSCYLMEGCPSWVLGLNGHEKPGKEKKK